MEKQPCVYILAKKRNGATYVGVTSDLPLRVSQHRMGLFEGHAKRHGIKILVWFEQHATMESAIMREKQFKNWKRVWKLEMIEKDNPLWRDLAEDLGFDPL